jgi:hypothetical protein
MTTTTKTSAFEHPATTASTTVDELTQRARDAATTVTGAAGELSARLPEAASEVDRIIRSGSDDTLRLATVAVVGFAIGLLAGGSNRLLILASLIPAGLMGVALSSRRPL